MKKYVVYALGCILLILLTDWLLLKFRSRFKLDDEPKDLSEKIGDFLTNGLTIFCLLFIVAGGWLGAIHDSQFAPHHITSSINGNVLTDFWTTNPAYVVYSPRLVVGSNGVQVVQDVKTNYYWHVWSVWSIFKK